MNGRFGFQIRIGLSILIAFTLSAFLFRYITIADKPEFNTAKLFSELEDTKLLAVNTVSAIAGLPARLLPQISIETTTGLAQNSNPPSQPGQSVSSAEQSSSVFFDPGQPNTNSSSSSPPLPPVSSSSSLPPGYPTPPTSQQNSPTPALPKITSTPKPTKVPKPTAVPKLTLEARRPGNSFQEVIRILSPIVCVPEPMMWATLENEYGPWMSQVEANWGSRNTLQGQDTTAVSGSTVIVGVTQMMQDTWFRIKPYVMQKFNVSDMSLNVTFDSIAAGSYHQRNISLAGTDKQPCDDWDVKYILYAACRYNGACPPNTMGQTQYYNTYTYKVCEAYNRFTTGPKKKCQ